MGRWKPRSSRCEETLVRRRTNRIESAPLQTSAVDCGRASQGPGLLFDFRDPSKVQACYSQKTAETRLIGLAWRERPISGLPRAKRGAPKRSWLLRARLGVNAGDSLL